MVVIYCDVCGRRINTKNESKFKLTCYKDSDPSPIYDKDDVCEYCIDSINEYITQLKLKECDY